MKTLTKSQRFTVYCILLAIAEEFVKQQPDQYGIFMTRDGSMAGGMCDVICHEFDTGSLFALDTLGLKELASMKPIQTWNKNYWFPTTVDGWKTRIELIKECIRRTS